MNAQTRRIIYVVAVVIGAVAFGFGIIDREAMDTLTTQIVDVASSAVMIGTGLLATINTHRGSDSTATRADVEAAAEQGREQGIQDATASHPVAAPAPAPEPFGELPDPVTAAREALAVETAPTDQEDNARHSLREGEAR